jgi:hypothetical protein
MGGDLCGEARQDKVKFKVAGREREASLHVAGSFALAQTIKLSPPARAGAAACCRV